MVKFGGPGRAKQTSIMRQGYIDENEKNKLDFSVKKIKTALSMKNVSHSSHHAMMLLKALENEIRKSTYSKINFCNLLKSQCSNLSADSHVTISGRKKNTHYFNPLVKCEESSVLKKFMNKKVKPELSCVVSSDIHFDNNKDAALQNMENEFFESVVPQENTHYFNPLVKCEESSVLKKFMNKKVKPELSCVVSSDIHFDNNKDAALQNMENEFFESVVPQGTGKWLKSLNWSGKKPWYTASTKLFKFRRLNNCDVLGFRKSYDNLHYFTLLKSGHFPYKEFPEIILSIMEIASKHETY